MLPLFKNFNYVYITTQFGLVLLSLLAFILYLKKIKVIVLQKKNKFSPES